MLHAAFFCLLVGQVPPPPVPHPPESYERSPSAESPIQGPAGMAAGPLDRRFAGAGQLNAQKQREVERMVNEAIDRQVDDAVQYYQQQLAQAQANLRRLIAYRDYLRREVERRKQVYEQEQAITAYGSALAAQQAQWAMGNFYAAPYYYAPYPHHRHHW